MSEGWPSSGHLSDTDKVMYSLTFHEYLLDRSGTNIAEFHHGLILLSCMRSAHPRECSDFFASKESFLGLLLEGPEFIEDLLGFN